MRGRGGRRLKREITGVEEVQSERSRESFEFIKLGTPSKKRQGTMYEI